MNLPKDPVMLLSVVNTQLPSLDELAAAHMIDVKEIEDKLAKINYLYNKERNQFV